ncbi:hypothetical protein [Hymenobacter chitinivorans]|uniref:Uncharacterized protein n=1 Tax=Hymenobacter chitinivorans DSM 11115 TaxID=1121954 RepID=A0A2M9BLP0_9BACT|nr:hypothetical protein [Hymenobacter chitinivorans]PJJ58852.1 hypothetical protein CLV45_0263 [Hymenobacter chitinivorans DSM 11115]
MVNLRVILIAFAVMFLGLILWMGYFFYFRTDGRGHVLRVADNPAAAARGQQLLGRADALLQRQRYNQAQALLDSLRDADANPAMFISTDELMQRFDTLRVRRARPQPAP